MKKPPIALTIFSSWIIGITAMIVTLTITSGTFVHSETTSNVHHHDHQEPSLSSASTSSLASSSSSITMKDVEEYLNSVGFTFDDVCAAARYEYEYGYKYNSYQISATQERNLRDAEDQDKSQSQVGDDMNEKDGNKQEEQEGETENPNYIKNSLLALICVTVAALAAGLTMGLLSQELLDLKIKEIASSSEDARKQASNLVPLIKDHHRLVSGTTRYHTELLVLSIYFLL
jgi:hypothetical protein